MQGGDFRRFEVDGSAAGTRLDAFLAASLSLSRAETRRLLAQGVVRLGGRACDASAKGHRLRAGESVEVAPYTPRADQEVLPAAEPARTQLGQGPGWLALDKPPGTPVHPYRPDETGTLTNFAVTLHPELQGVGEGGLKSGVVHRLDVDTSGVVVLATEADTWRRLRRGFRKHRVAKTYRAIVLGDPDERGEIELPLRVAQHRPARVAVVAAAGTAASGVWRARLSWQVLERLRGASLLEVALETGFLHQIRVTLAHLGTPVAGDALYGGGVPDPSGAARQMLHAAHVAFEEIDVASPDPPDFAAVLAHLRA